MCKLGLAQILFITKKGINLTTVDLFYEHKILYFEREHHKFQKIYGVLLTFSPAAADTIKSFLEDTKTSPMDYDMIFTGDLGQVGSELLYELLGREGIDLKGYHKDCGNMIFDPQKQDVHAGASGCGCSASVLCSDILNKMRSGIMKNILFCATGALMSPTSSQQGESIPSIAHLVNIVI